MDAKERRTMGVLEGVEVRGMQESRKDQGNRNGNTTCLAFQRLRVHLVV
jgi:hypothetical protein